MKYRDHRGGLAESMETEQTFASRVDLIAYLHKELYTWGFEFPSSSVKIEPYGDGKDERIGWRNLHIVTIDGFGVVGFADIPTSDEGSAMDRKGEP